MITFEYFISKYKNKIQALLLELIIYIYRNSFMINTFTTFDDYHLLGFIFIYFFLNYLIFIRSELS